MSSLTRRWNPSAITKEDVNWNKKSHIKMLKMALFDCAINEKCCSVDGGRGICSLFSSPPRGIWQLKSPHPREFAIQSKKNANARGSARWGAGRRWNWLMHYVMSRWWGLKRIPSSRSRDIQKSAKIKKNWNKAALRQLVHEKTG